jgi:nicotinate phosphoribosyltransferase
VSTNALRIRIAAGEKCELLEFGLRRAQGPDGGLSASKYAVIGGFDGTSNVMAGNLYGIPVKGTHAHAYVMSYLSLSSLNSTTLARKGDLTATQIEFVSVVLEKRKLLYGDAVSQCNDSELAAFISYAQAFPDGLLALVDTYDTLKSGVPNFISVGMALLDFGYKPVGIRLDSGDLAYLSRQTKSLFREADAKLLLGQGPVFENCKIVASNDLDEQTIYSLIQQGHEITTFGVGTNLVTCKKQPALGCVYKLVEISGEPRIKLSEDIEKVVIPARKNVYRLTGANGHPLIDILQRVGESPPEAGKKILCRHPFEEAKRANVTPVKVEALLQLVYDGAREKDEVVCKPLPSIMEIRAFVMEQVKAMRPDHMRAVNPTPYKVSTSEALYDYIHRLWLANAPIAEIT